jgi:hypothetical protein
MGKRMATPNHPLGTNRPAATLCDVLEDLTSGYYTCRGVRFNALVDEG